jgi:hypothetical protein
VPPATQGGRVWNSEGVNRPSWGIICWKSSLVSIVSDIQHSKLDCSLLYWQNTRYVLFTLCKNLF